MRRSTRFPFGDPQREGFQGNFFFGDYYGASGLAEVVEVEGGDFAVGDGEFLEDVGAGRGGFDFPEVCGSVGGVEGG